MFQTIIMHTNGKGRIQWANSSLCSLADSHPETIIGQSCFDVISAISTSGKAFSIPDFLQDTAICQFETPLTVSAAGLIIHWEVVREVNQDIIYLIGTDYTQARMREQVQQLTLTLSKNYLTQNNISEIFDEILKGVLDITGSEYGFMGEILTDENGAPFLKTYALTNIAWDKASRDFYEQHRKSGFEFKNLNTLFGYSIRKSEIIIANDAPNDHRKGGIPHGHPALNHYMGLPVKLSNGEMVGLLGLANRPSGYTMELADQLKVFLDLFANIIKVKKEEVQRKRAEQELIIAHQTTDSIINALETSQVVVLTDPDGIIIRANDIFAGISQYPVEELIGRHISSFFVQPDQGDFWGRIIADLGQNRFWRGEILNEAKDGSPFWLDMIFNPIANEVNEVYQYLAIGNLITDRKETEHKLETARVAAESSLRAKRIFIANVSHELRTPLHVILGFGEQLLKTLSNNEDSKKLMMIRDSAKGLLEIINDIIDHTQAEEGKLKLREEVLDMTSIINDIYSLLQPAAQEKNIDFHVDINGPLPGLLIGDPVRLRQVLINVLSNSLKFTEEGIVSLLVFIEPETDGVCWIEFVCQDTGIGISNEMMSKLFTEFSQEDESFQRRYGGSGLGLSITKEIVDKMGGTIAVESQKTKGSVFRIRIPFAQKEQNDKKDQTESSPITAPHPLDLSHIRMLVAEDNVLNKEVIRMMLASFGIVPDMVENGLQAMDLCNQFEYDIILMDIQMPDMDGLTAVKNIRLNGKNREKPILAITANAIKSEIHHYLEIGFTDYLTKPFDQQGLYQKIVQHLAHLF